MNALVPATTSLYRQKEPVGLSSQLAARARSWDALWKSEYKRQDSLVLAGNVSSNIETRRPARRNSLNEELFSELVKLKIAVAQYAMHLSRDTRHKIFDDLDSLLNPDDWYEEDKLPQMTSFRDFLKWTVYAKRFNWISLGISNDGHIQAAWKSERGLLTARYTGNGRVLWTAKIIAEGGDDHLAGDSSLQSLERQAHFYLDAA